MSWTVTAYQLLARERMDRYLQEASGDRRAREAVRGRRGHVAPEGKVARGLARIAPRVWGSAALLHFVAWGPWSKNGARRGDCGDVC